MKLIIALASICSLLVFNDVSTIEKPVLKKPLQADLYVSHYENVLGTALEMKFLTYSESEAEKAEEAALNEINRLSSIFSAYDHKSEFSKWKSLKLNESVKVSAELFEMFHLFELWKQKSHGAINANVAVGLKVWENSAKMQQLPSAAELLEAVKSMQEAAYTLNYDEQSITKRAETDLLMNSFAKSYIIQKANEAAKRTTQVESAIVNIGGDLVVSGVESELIKVMNPFDAAENAKALTQIKVSNKAVATSGNYQRGVQIGDTWYSHILDPRTAKPASDIVSATVVADEASTAGALATAFNVLNREEIAALAAEYKDLAYLLVFKSGEILKSTNWKNYEVVETPLKLETKEPLVKADGKAWDSRFELEVSFNFNAISGNMRRPFVAIWVENAQKKSVRNLALMYNKTKWVPDLRNWYRINGVSFKANKENYASVTGATKSPGKYVIKWDGKDDQGRYVAQGNYTILIETSKEHGTDEFLKQNLELKKSPIKVSNTGNVEISNVVYEFKKK